MEGAGDLEQLGEAELRKKLEVATTYEERSKIRSVLRRLRKESSTASLTDGLSYDAASPAVVQVANEGGLPALAPQSTYRRTGYRVQKDPPLHYGVCHWESLSAVPSLAIRQGRDPQKAGISSPTSTSAPPSAGTAALSSTAAAPSSVTSMGQADDSSANRRPSDERPKTPTDEQETDGRRKSVNDGEDVGDGVETQNGYRSESRLSTRSFRSEGGESVASLDSVQSDLEQEDTLQKQIESSQDYDEGKMLRARLRQVQQRRMSKCQMSTGSDSRPSSRQEEKESDRPSWVKLARKKSNPSSMTERRESKAAQEEKAKAEELYKGMPLRKTGRLERKPSIQDAPLEPPPAEPESPYKSVQLKKTGVLDAPATGIVRTSSKDSDGGSPYKSVQLKRTGTLERLSSNASLTLSEGTATPEPVLSPYKSVQLRKTGVLETEASPARRQSVSRTDQQESPYKSVTLRTTGKRDTSATHSNGSATLTSPSEPEAANSAHVTADSGDRPSDPFAVPPGEEGGHEWKRRGSTLRQTGVLERERRPSVTEPTDPKTSKKSADSPWKVSLKKVSSTATKSPPTAARTQKPSATETAKSSVNYLSVLRKKRTSTAEPDGPQAPTTSGSTSLQRRASTSEATGAEYLSVLKRRNVTGDPVSSSPKRGTSKADTPDYLSVLKSTLKRTDSRAMDDFGRPKGQGVDHLPVRNSQDQVAASISPEPTDKVEAQTASTLGVVTRSKMTNGHTADSDDDANEQARRDLERRHSGYNIHNDIILPGGVRITPDEETDV